MRAALAAVLLLAAAPAGAAVVRQAGRHRLTPMEEKQPESWMDAASGWATYAANRGAASARPDGSGAALNRLELFLRDRAASDQLHLQAESVFLSDRYRGAFKPASLDYYLALARHGSGSFVQVGRDEAMPLDGAGSSSRYWDLRYGWTGGKEGGLSVLSIGWFFKNDGHSARPDRSGEAFLRYALAFESVLSGPVGMRLAADFITDEDRRRFLPAACDLSVALTVGYREAEGFLAYEPRLSLDRSGSVDAWLLGASYRFDSRGADKLR